MTEEQGTTLQYIIKLEGIISQQSNLLKYTEKIESDLAGGEVPPEDPIDLQSLKSLT
jgi:hypothetical protein